MTASSPDSAAGELLPATRRALGRRVAAGQAEGRTPSLVGAVVRDGRQVWCGARSMPAGHEPDGDTQYRIGSLTKTFVAVLTMRLRDEGRLDLADPLGKYLDAGPEPSEGTGLMAPAGELWSTAEDLCRFAVFLLDGDDRVLAARTLADMRIPAAPPGDNAWASGYGLGLQLFRLDGRLLYGHAGSMPGFMAILCVSADDGVGAIVLANATSGPDIGAIVSDLVKIVAEGEPRLPARWQPLAEVDQELLALTGLWYWGPRPYLLRLRADRAVELSPATARGRGSVFRAGPDGTWTGLDGYYAGETLRVIRGTGDAADHLDLGSFVFTREPYGPGAVPAARPDQKGWRAV